MRNLGSHWSSLGVIWESLGAVPGPSGASRKPSGAVGAAPWPVVRRRVRLRGREHGVVGHLGGRVR
eukprot:8431961-Pyramimonas_sp.AAC.1